MQNDNSIDRNTILNKLFDNTYIGILVIDSNRNIILVNDKLCNLLDYKQDELINQSVEKIHINENHYKYFGIISSKHLLQNNSFSINFEFRKKDGTSVLAKVSADKLEYKDQTLWTFVDITENSHILNKLKEQSDLLKTVIDEIPYPVVLKNAKAKFVLVNKSTAKLYGSTPEKMIGKDDSDFIPDKEMAELFKKNVISIMEEGKTCIVYEDSIDVETNEIKNYMSIKKPFKNIHGESFILVLANDITELNTKNKELAKKEKLLFQQSKMASMGEMIENIAHQWRQPLTMISSCATGVQLQKELDILDEDYLNQALTTINKSSQYLSKTIDDFRNFFKQDKNSTEFSISEVWKDSINLVKSRMTTHQIKIIENLEPQTISSYKNELIQVIVNIVNNSIDALKQSTSKRYIYAESKIEEDIIIIKISDTAGGINEEIIEKVFDPYFTTKHKSQGTGIGLYMTQEIVVKHLKGEVFVENSNFTIENIEYKGAVFTIKLPLNIPLNL